MNTDAAIEQMADEAFIEFCKWYASKKLPLELLNGPELFHHGFRAGLNAQRDVSSIVDKCLKREGPNEPA